jgi:predicted PurR-regulated permease PerM
MFLLVAGPISMVTYRLYVYFSEISKAGFQNTELFKKLVLLRSGLLHGVNLLLESLHLENTIDFGLMSEDALTRIGNIVVEISTGFAYHLPGVLLSVLVFCVALYFFLAEGRMVKAAFLRMQFLTRTEAEALIKVLQRSCFNVVVTSLALGCLAATLVSLGALIFQGGDFLVVWVVTFFCSFIPVIGAGPVALALGLYKLLMGYYGEAIGFVGVAIVVGIVDNGVRPYLISSNEEVLHPAVSLLALIGALVIFGMPGVFLGPVIASVAIRIVPIFYPQPGPASRAISGRK